MEESPERRMLRPVDGGQEIGGRHFPEAVQRQQIAARQREQVGDRPDEFSVDERVHGFLTDAANIERVARAEVSDGALQLGGARQAVRASVERPVVFHRYAARGTPDRHPERRAPASAGRGHARHYVGNDVACAHDAPVVMAMNMSGESAASVVISSLTTTADGSNVIDS